MNLHRYNVTLDQGCGEPRTLSIVAKDTKQAKDKAFHQFTNGLPFWTFTRSNLTVTCLESVTGPMVLQ